MTAHTKNKLRKREHIHFYFYCIMKRVTWIKGTRSSSSR